MNKIIQTPTPQIFQDDFHNVYPEVGKEIINVKENPTIVELKYFEVIYGAMKNQMYIFF